MKRSVRDMRKIEKMGHSLTFKWVVIVVLLMLFLSLLILASGLAMFFTSSLDEYRRNTCTYAKAEAVALNQEKLKAKTQEIIDIYDSLPEEVQDNQEAEDYRAPFVDAYDSDLHELQAQMRMMQYGIGLRNAFIVAIDEEKNRMIYLIDADPRPESVCFPGTWDEYPDKVIQVLVHGGTTSKLEELFGLNDEYHATITNLEQYGLRCTGGYTIYKTGKYSVVLCLDEKLDHLTSMTFRFVRRFLVLLFFAILIGAIIAIVNMRKRVANPLSQMATAARDYADDKSQGISAPNRFSQLDIKTGDEIEELSLAMKEMESGLIEYEQNLKTMTAEQERINTELDLATRIQRDMLPSVFPAFPEREDFDIYASMDPAKEVGGDFYDFFLIDDDHLGVMIADVAGKGVPAALFMMVSKTILDNFMMSGLSPAKVLQNTNDTICARNQEEMFVTVWIAVLEISTGRVMAGNAGHENPVIIKADGTVELYKDKHDFVIGGMEGLPYHEYELQLEPGDKIFVYTDGVAEATDANKELFGVERMLEALREEPDADPQDILKNVRASVDAFVGEAEQFDDLTMLCLKYKGK